MSTKQREYKQCREKFTQLLKEKCNRKCADCGMKAPTWTSEWRVCDAAVFVCLRCAGIHRGLGTHNTFVQSATIDNWNIAKFKKFRNQGGGNNTAMNAMYEAKLPKYSKPTDQTEKYVLKEFIKQKYIERKWYSNKPKKVKKKNTSQPLLENKEKNMDKDKPSKKEYDIEFEEKSAIMTVKYDYKSPQNQPQSQPIPDLLSASQMQAIAPTQAKSAGNDLFDDIFSNPNTSSMDNDASTNSKQNIMNMFKPKPKNNGNGIHDTFNPNFSQQQNDYSPNKMRKWNQTGQYQYGARLANDTTIPQNKGNGWSAFDDMGQNKADSKSVIMQQYKQKPSDNFMTSIYGAPEYMNNNQYVNNNNYAMNVNPLKNDGYKKNNYKPMNNNKPKATLSTVSMGDDLFSEFKI